MQALRRSSRLVGALASTTASASAVRTLAPANGILAPQAMAKHYASGCPGYHEKPLPKEAVGDLLEYSVVYTDRAINHMSKPFCKTMNELTGILKEVYNAEAAVMLPGSGTYAMESVARQFATNKKVIVLRNGYFSYRWTDIFEQCAGLPENATVMMGRPMEDGPTPGFTPAPIEEVVAEIKKTKPAVVFAPHVETSTGILLPDSYIKAVADAVHAEGGVFVLDCIASGMLWVDMKATGADVIITAPQKGWTGPACVGIAMLSERAVKLTKETTSTSMVLNLRKWLELSEQYENGGFMYYTTLPTDAMTLFRNIAVESKEYGFDKLKEAQSLLGSETRAMMKAKGYKSVAAEGFEAPGVVVAYTTDGQIYDKFKANGLQTAAGVPFMIEEPAGIKTFRIGLFGLDKVTDRPKTIGILENVLDKIQEEQKEEEAATA